MESEFLERQIIRQLEGGQAKTDTELVSDLAITRGMVKQTMDKLVNQAVVRIASSEDSPEVIYTLKKKPRELRSSAFVEKMRQAGFLD